MRTQRIRNLAVLFGSVLVASAIGAHPSNAAVELSELLVGGATFEVGDNLVFSDFTFSSTGDMPSSGGLFVDAFQDGFGNLGIRLSGGMTDSAGGGASTIDLGYRVSTVDGMGIMGAGIAAATLAGNPIAIGEGIFTITESFSEIPTTLTIFDQAPGGTKLLDTMALPSTLSSLNVDLSVMANAITGGATASFIDQTFAVEADGVVPEPASLVIWLGTLILFGVVPLSYRRWWMTAQPARSHAAR